MRQPPGASRLAAGSLVEGRDIIACRALGCLATAPTPRNSTAMDDAEQSACSRTTGSPAFRSEAIATAVDGAAYRHGNSRRATGPDRPSCGGGDPLPRHFVTASAPRTADAVTQCRPGGSTADDTDQLARVRRPPPASVVAPDTA